MHQNKALIQIFVGCTIYNVKQTPTVSFSIVYSHSYIVQIHCIHSLNENALDSECRFLFLFQWFSNKQTRMRLLFTTQTHKDSIQTYNGFVFDMSSFCGKITKPHTKCRANIQIDDCLRMQTKCIQEYSCGWMWVERAKREWFGCNMDFVPISIQKSSCYCPCTVIEQSQRLFCQMQTIHSIWTGSDNIRQLTKIRKHICTKYKTFYSAQCSGHSSNCTDGVYTFLERFCR